jgi:integrase
MSSPAELRKNEETGVWYVHYIEGRRTKRVSTRERNMVAAQAFFGQWLLMDVEATAQPVRLTCAEIWAAYWSGHVMRQVGCRNTVEDAWKNASKAFGQLRPSEVTQARFDAYAADRGAGRIGRPSQLSTVWKESRILLASWNYAVKHRLIASTELPILALPPPPLPRERWLTHEEVAKLVKAAAAQRVGGRMSRGERFLWLGLETAGRRAALESLLWPQVDFETRVIHLNPPGRRQTSKRRADVPISDALLPILLRAFEERIGDYVLDAPTRVTFALDALAKAAGVAGVTPHVLRHTAATHMARNNVSLWKIAGVLGNTVAMVESVYAKHSPDSLREAVNSMGAKMGA